MTKSDGLKYSQEIKMYTEIDWDNLAKIEDDYISIGFDIFIPPGSYTTESINYSKEVSRCDIYIDQIPLVVLKSYLIQLRIAEFRLTVKERAVQRQNKKRRKK